MYPNMSSNDSGLYGMIHYANVVTDNWTGSIIIFLVLLILFISLSRYGSRKAISAAIFVVSIVGIILRAVNVVNDYVVILCVVTTIFSFLWLAWGSD